jgi:hypothetical protein
MHRQVAHSKEGHWYVSSLLKSLHVQIMSIKIHSRVILYIYQSKSHHKHKGIRVEKTCLYIITVYDKARYIYSEKKEETNKQKKKSEIIFFFLFFYF